MVIINDTHNYAASLYNYRLIVNHVFSCRNGLIDCIYIHVTMSEKRSITHRFRSIRVLLTSPYTNELAIYVNRPTYYYVSKIPEQWFAIYLFMRFIVAMEHESSLP
jgi:hypothetical protein